MQHRLSMHELLLVAGAVALGCYLRFAETDQLAVEHFDEGVYSSTLWYDQLSGQTYPFRHLYAPPALPLMIDGASSFAGPRLAPFVPGLLTGALTVILVWGFTRAAFGMVSGLVVILLAALSDFHILYSRMALTDAPALMWIVLAVWCGTSGIDRQSAKMMILAGIACGCAWWTKYTGWLPIAIVSSGSLFWWTVGGHRQCSLGRLAVLNGVLAVSACVIWCPWLWALQSVGGYEAVAANHSGYHTTWQTWSKNLENQITWYSFTDSSLAALALTLGVMFGGSHRWFQARCSTWNRCAHPGTGITPGLLVRFLSAATVLCIATLTIGSFAVLTSLAAAGITGLILWPSFTVLTCDSKETVAERDHKSKPDSNFDRGDFHASPDMNPHLAACIVTAWFCGLILSLPTYTPFPRLLLPLLAVIWIAAAGGIGWWVEACINVARKNAGSGIRPHKSMLQIAVAGLVVVSLLLGMWQFEDRRLTRSVIHDSRLALRNASDKVAEMCRKETGADVTPEDMPQFVVYAFGEPSVLCQLSQTGIIARPVQDLKFPAATITGKRLPTFLVFGPNALRTPGFMYDWVDAEQRFEHVGDVSYEPSSIVLCNLFSPQWIMQHPGAERAQQLEVYLLRNRNTEE